VAEKRGRGSFPEGRGGGEGGIVANDHEPDRAGGMLMATLKALHL